MILWGTADKSFIGKSQRTHILNTLNKFVLNNWNIAEKNTLLEASIPLLLINAENFLQESYHRGFVARINWLEAVWSLSWVGLGQWLSRPKTLSRVRRWALQASANLFTALRSPVLKQHNALLHVVSATNGLKECTMVPWLHRHKHSAVEQLSSRAFGDRRSLSWCLAWLTCTHLKMR